MSASINWQYWQHDLSDSSSIRFCSFPLDQPFLCRETKQIDRDLSNVLSDPYQYQDFHIGKEKIDKIFIGFATSQPSNYDRFPVWLPPDFISSHILIGGSIGSGKTSLTYRLVAGALNTYGTVIIGEAKAGLKGYSDGAAFTNIAKYLARHLSAKAYRWPRGNCWFNPLIYLKNKEDRKNFMTTIAEQIEIGSGDLQAYVQRAADIAANVLEYLDNISLTDEVKRRSCTLRELVYFLKNPGKLEKDINGNSETKTKGKLEELKELSKNSQYRNRLESLIAKVEAIKIELERLNFFALKDNKGRDSFAMTASGLNLFIDLIDNEDLFHYSESNSKGRDGQLLTENELKLDDILYDRALVVVSQPLNDQHSKVTGPFFWDTLLNYVLELGPNPKKKNGKSREKVAVFLDETHRLPVGQLGNAGDFLRQYNIGLVEITPAVVDKERWQKNKHVYQTIISLSPGIYDVLELIYDRLPNQQQQFFKIGFETTVEGSLRVIPQINDREFKPGEDNPGVSVRSLRKTGKYTALLHSEKINNTSGCFWIDLESELLQKFDLLLEEALTGDEQAIKLVAYTLGLVKEYSG